VNTGGFDAFVAKVRADGTGLVYCGYLGGSQADQGSGIAVDGSGNAYVVGSTGSPRSGKPADQFPFTFDSGVDGLHRRLRGEVQRRRHEFRLLAS